MARATAEGSKAVVPKSETTGVGWWAMLSDPDGRVKNDRWAMASIVAKAAARGDVHELVRLAWAYGGSENEPEINQALQWLAPRLRERGELEQLAYMLNLPAYKGISRSIALVVDELIAAGGAASAPVLSVARQGSREAKLRAIRVLEAIGNAPAAAELRQWLPAREPRSQLAGISSYAVLQRQPVMAPIPVAGAVATGSSGWPVVAFVVSLLTFLILPRLASAFWVGGFTWSAAVGAGVSSRAVTAGMVCLVIAIPGPFVYGWLRKKYAHRPGSGLATAAFVISIVCLAQLFIGLAVGDLLLPRLLGPTLTPVGPF